MSRLDDYVAGAVSTESKIEEVKVNKQFLNHILAMHIASGDILDQIKKHAFYNRDYDFTKIDRNIATLHRSLTNVTLMTVDEVDDAETVLDIDPRIFHAIVGSATESVELLEALEYDGKEMDLVNIGEEYGDINWYQAIFCDAAGIKWEDILETNAQKLYKANQARYKDGFSDDDANERKLDDEREVLDKLKIKSA